VDWLLTVLQVVATGAAAFAAWFAGQTVVESRRLRRDYEQDRLIHRLERCLELVEQMDVFLERGSVPLAIEQQASLRVLTASAAPDSAARTLSERALPTGMTGEARVWINEARSELRKALDEAREPPPQERTLRSRLSLS
jgi:hypothetical protein